MWSLWQSGLACILRLLQSFKAFSLNVASTVFWNPDMSSHSRLMQVCCERLRWHSVAHYNSLSHYQYAITTRQSAQQFLTATLGRPIVG